MRPRAAWKAYGNVYGARVEPENPLQRFSSLLTDTPGTRWRICITVFPFKRRRSLRLGAATQPSLCDSCPLATCKPGSRATVVCISCPALDSQRLRMLGLFEGVQVGVIDTRSGVVLDVRGSRLALGWAVVAGISVRPLRPARA